MLELPKGVWQWISKSSRDLSRITSAAERIADELKLIRETLEETDETKEEK